MVGLGQGVSCSIIPELRVLLWGGHGVVELEEGLMGLPGGGVFIG